MALPTGQSPGATARALAGANPIIGENESSAPFPFSLISAAYGADEPPDLTVVPPLPKGPRHDFLQEQIDHMRAGGDLPGGEWVSEQQRQEIIKDLQEAQHRESQGALPPSVEDALRNDPTYIPPGDIYTGPKLVPPPVETRGFWSNIGRGLAGLGATAFSAPVLAGIAGVGSAFYPTRMGRGDVAMPGSTYDSSEALREYRINQLQEAQEALDKPWWGSELMERLNERFPVVDEPWWGGDLIDAGKNLVSSIISPAAASHTDSGVGGDEIPTTVDVMPVIPPPADFRSNMPVYDPVAVSFSRATPQVFYTDSGPMPTQEQIDISVENLGRLHREAQQAGPMESQVSQALSDYAFGRDVQPELQAITQLAEVDPTFNFEKYLDPTSQEIMDITSQVDSFSDIRDRAAEDQRQRDREQDQREERLEKAADDRRKSEQQARVEAKASAAAKRAETRKIASENKARKAEEKRIASKQASEEKQRRAVEKQMADMLKQAEETRQAYLERKRQEEDRRRRAGFGVGAMWT